MIAEVKGVDVNSLGYSQVPTFTAFVGFTATVLNPCMSDLQKQLEAGFQLNLLHGRGAVAAGNLENRTEWVGVSEGERKCFQYPP